MHGQLGTRPEAAIAELAASQHGLVARDQLAALGSGRGAIEHRVARGRLHVVHRGVYAIGHRLLTRDGHWMAAVLAVGPGAVLSHRSAAALWGMRDTLRAAIEVTAARKCRRPGIEAHRAVLLPDEVTVRRGIPVTNPARTLLDPAAVVSQRELEHALNEAEIQKLTSPISLDAVVARHPNRNGTTAIKRALRKQREIGETVTKSRLERRFLELLDEHDIPRPRTNEPLGPYLPDALWADQRLVVELDSYGIHTTRRAFEQDRARDRALTTAGYRVIRISWRRLQNEPRTIARELITLLDSTPSPRSARRARRPPRATPATRSAAP
jgi:very-short-patch-repair endonuclease